MGLGIYVEGSFARTLLRTVVVAAFIWSVVFTIHEMATDDYSGVIIGTAGFLFFGAIISVHLWRQEKKKNKKIEI